MAAIGLTLQPDVVYLDLLHAAFADVDYVEIAPETTWRTSGPDRALSPNAFSARFAEIVDECGVWCVAHGVGLSLGTPRDEARWAVWLERIRADHELFRFAWYTDHLGFTATAGACLRLPLPVPMTPEAARVVGENLAALSAVVPAVGIENSVFYFQLGDPMDDGAFLHSILDGEGRHLLLDLHNVYTLGVNAGVDVDAYIDRLPLDRVIEIHLSGGVDSDAGWLPGGKRLRLDSHDSSVPEPVWDLLARVGPRCAHLRGVTLERMEGTVTAHDVAPIRAELARARRLAEAW